MEWYQSTHFKTLQLSRYYPNKVEQWAVLIDPSISMKQCFFLHGVMIISGNKKKITHGFIHTNLRLDTFSELPWKDFLSEDSNLQSSSIKVIRAKVFPFILASVWMIKRTDLSLHVDLRIVIFQRIKTETCKEPIDLTIGR